MSLATRNKSAKYCCSKNSTSTIFYICYFIESFKYLHSYLRNLTMCLRKSWVQNLKGIKIIYVDFTFICVFSNFDVNIHLIHHATSLLLLGFYKNCLSQIIASHFRYLIFILFFLQNNYVKTDFSLYRIDI